jgi:hypothetical protein
MRLFGYNLLPFDSANQGALLLALDVVLPDITSQVRARVEGIRLYGHKFRHLEPRAGQGLGDSALGA